MNEPALSVVLTLVDHRGHAAECVGSWTRGQTLARERYEVVVVSDGSEPDVEAAAAAMLTPADRLLHQAGGNELALHDHGARHARGRWLLFTEGHCAAEPGCLEALLAHLEAHWPARAGACIRSTADGSTHPLSRLEWRWYEEGFRAWSREGDWRKVTIRGFALRRDVYLAVGGFEHDVGCFAETALAATLHARGYRLGYVPAAAVKHYNPGRLAELLAYVREYREGEVAYRRRCPPSHADAYFGPSGARFAPGGSRWWAPRCAARSLGAALVSRHRPAARALMARTMLGQLVRSSVRALLPDAGGRLAARLACARARLRFAWPGLDDDERYRRFCRLWDAAGDLARLRALARLPGPPAPQPGPGFALEYRPGELPADSLVGFHGRELRNGSSFRWTAPLARLPVRLPPGDYEVVVETGALRGADLRGLVDLYLNAHRAPLARALPGRGRLAFRVASRMFRDAPVQHLALTSARPRTRNPDERRALGIPVFAVTFRPVDAGDLAGAGGP